MNKKLNTKIEESTDVKTMYVIVNRLNKQSTPFFHTHEERAIDIFLASANSDSNWKPEDYELVSIGKWNTKTMELKGHKAKIIALGKFKKQLTKELEEVIAKVVAKHYNILEQNKKGK